MVSNLKDILKHIRNDNNFLKFNSTKIKRVHLSRATNNPSKSGSLATVAIYYRLLYYTI